MPLPQPLRIARKDLLHLWPETLVVVALFVAFAASAPSRYTGSPYLTGIALLSGLLKLLMPLSWLVLISRLIHDEPLVGDRQFWTSRPYHWASLLAAKLLYLVVFLYIPFFLMQAYLLKHAGLYPMLALPALLHNLLLLTVVIVVPLVAIAAVTATFPRMLLSSVGALLYLLALGVALFFLQFQRMIPPALTPFVIAVFILLPVIALVYQYKTRKTTIARWMLLATPLVIFLLILITPATALIRAAYPVAGSGAPVLGPTPAELVPQTPPTGRVFALRNVQVTLPVGITGGDEKNVYVLDGASASLAGDQLPYMVAEGAIGGPAPYAVVPLAIPTATYEKLKSTPTDLHLSIAANHLVVKDPQQWRATLLPFAVPGHGVCSYPSADNPDADPNQQPVCHFPLTPPENTFVSAPLQLSCAAQAPGQPPQQATAGQRISRDKSPFDLPDFDPVVTIPLNLQVRQKLPPNIHLSLCPGSFLSFIQAQPAGRTRFEVDQKQVLLDNYAVRIPERNEAPTAPQQ